jgi:hypothetical protein
VEKHMTTYGNYNPYGELDSWYGTPNYGSAYNSYLGGQMQPLPLSRLVSMVNEIQQGMNRQPLGNQSVNMSTPTQMEMPAQIAANIMNTQNRLLSLPRQRMEQSGSNELQYDLTPPANTPAASMPTANRTTGGTSGGTFGYSPSNALPTISAAAAINRPSGVSSTPTAPTITRTVGNTSQPTYLQPKTNTNQFGNMSLNSNYFSGGGGGGLGGGGGGVR